MFDLNANETSDLHPQALPCNICAALRCPCARRNRPMPPWGCVPAWPLVDGWFAPGKSSSNAPCLSLTLLQRCS